MAAWRAISPETVFYDAHCAVCARLVAFVARRDREGSLRFAPLDGPEATKRLGAHGIDPRRAETLFLLAEAGTARERVLDRSGATLRMVQRLPWPWRALAALAVVPKGLRDRAYDAFARNRHRLPAATCRVD